MERPNFFNDQLITEDDMNYIISATATEVARRFQGNLGYSGGYNETALSAYTRNKAGVLGSPGDAASYTNLKIKTETSANQLTMYAGSALDINGELIYVSSSQALQKDLSTTNYTWTSTVGTNYIKISYATVSGSLKTDDEGNGFYTRYTSSWNLTINGTAPTTSEILLATFTGDSNGFVTSGTLVDTRQYLRWYTFADAVGIDPYNTSVSSIKTVGAHIRATGSSTPTLNNVHGLSYDDIGGSNTLLTKLHATEVHVNCMIPLYRTTACFASYLGTINSPTSNAYISFTAPSSAMLIVDGNPISGSLSSLYAIDAFNLNGDGDYYAIVDRNGTTSWQSTLTIDPLFTKTVDGYTRYATGHLNKDYFLLGVATVADNGDDITNWLDCRILYGTHPIDIGADYSESTISPHAVAGYLTRGSSLIDNLNRMRYQLGMSLIGTGSLWNTSVYPLTAGVTSNGDPYHSHTFDNLIDAKSNGVTINSILNPEYKMYQLDGVSIASSETSNYWVLNSTTTTTTYTLLWKDKETGIVPYIPPYTGFPITFPSTGWYEIEAGLQIVPSGTAHVNQYFLQLDIVEIVGTGSTVINSSVSSLIDIDGAGSHAQYTENALPIKNKIYYKAEVASGNVSPSTIFVKIRPYIYNDASITIPVILYKPTYQYTETVDDGVREINCAFQNYLSVKKIKNI